MEDHPMLNPPVPKRRPIPMPTGTGKVNIGRLQFMARRGNAEAKAELLRLAHLELERVQGQGGGAA